MSGKASSVQYERLRPAQVVARRQACPVAYLPIGTIEWHGEHNPLGLDTLKSHALMIRCAEEIGGLVFPPLYYGEHRENGLMEARADDREQIVAKMGLPADSFAPGYMKESIEDQNRNYHQLLKHVFHEIRSLGFKVLVVSAGHYPLLTHARNAIDAFNKEQSLPGLIVWAMTGYELVEGQFVPCGDHAGKWETSMLMHLDPGMQDLSLLPKDRSVKPIGVSRNPVQDSNAEFGKQVSDAIIKAVQTRVEDLLKNHDQYQKSASP